MINLTADQIRSVMDKKDNIRNMSIMNTMKDCLTECLVDKAGITVQAKAGEMRFTDTRKDVQTSSMPIYKSLVKSLYYELSPEDMKYVKQNTTGNDFLINIIDTTSGDDADYNPTALNIIDGALVVVDCLKGLSVQTETVLRQAITKRIKLVFFMNTVDRALLELQLEKEVLYQIFKRNVDYINHFIATNNEENNPMGNIMVDPCEGTVGFGSILHKWGFNLKQFGEIYAAKFKIEPAKLMKYFWGDQYYNAKDKKWNTTGGDGYVRGFCQFVLEPLYVLTDAIMNFKKDRIDTMLDKLNIKLTSEKRELEGKPLLKVVLLTWLPVGDTVLQMIPIHLPSPVTAQNYRMELLYKGPYDDECAIGMKFCDVQRPLMMYVSEIIPIPDSGRLYVFGRVFSGKIATDLKVRIMGPNFKPGKKEDLFNKTVQRTVLMNGGYTYPIDDVPCGNVVGIMGMEGIIDGTTLETATITTHEYAHIAHIIK